MSTDILTRVISNRSMMQLTCKQPLLDWLSSVEPQSVLTLGVSISVQNSRFFSIQKWCGNRKIRLQSSQASVRLVKAHADCWQKQRAD